MAPLDGDSASPANQTAAAAFNRNTYWAVSFAFLLLALAAGWIFLRILGTLTNPDLSHVHDYALLFLGLCLGVAGLTTALVQIIRTLIPFRGGFHRKHLLERWQSAAADWNELLRRTGTEPLASAPAASAKLLQLLALPSGKQVDAEVALIEFEQRGKIHRSAKTSAAWLYDLPIEQLAGQLSLAIDAAQDEPPRYANLILCAFGPSALDLLLAALQPLPKFDREHPDEHAGKMEKIASARGSLSLLKQFEVDAFQIETSGPWRRGLRLWVVAVSTLISLVLMSASLYAASSGSYVHLPHKSVLGRLFSVPIYGILEGLIGGYLAMVLRDIIAIIESQRRRA